MKITMLTIGTRGEVQPCIALGLGLQAAGHEISIATHAKFETFIRDAGLGFFLIQGNPQEFLQSEAGRAILESGRDPVRLYRIFARTMNELFQQIGADCWAASQSADVILYTVGGLYFGPSIAEKLNVPAIATYPYPTFQPTCAFPSMFSPIQRNLGKSLNRLTHAVFDTTLWLPVRPVINKWRREQLRLPPLGTNYPRPYRQQQAPILYGFSPHVIPKPADWGDNVNITGYWFLDSATDWQPPPKLVGFLEDGDPPIYIGFGSMNTHDPEKTADTVLQALALTKQRGVLLAERDGLSTFDSSNNLFVIQSVPFDWLFPRMAAVVHHGGSGTTSAGLRAGVPSVVVPFFMDQPFWGQRVADLGVGPRPIPIKRLSAERLVAGITTAITDQEVRKRATALGKRICAEDGVSKAVEVIDRYLSSF
jgi:sterol 3beta-glucosyltransferase